MAKKKRRRSVKLRWKDSELARLLAIVAFLRPPLSSLHWGVVSDVYNKGLASTKQWRLAQLLTKFKQVESGPSTGGGGGRYSNGRRSNCQDVCDRIMKIMEYERDGSAITDEDFVWVRDLVSDADKVKTISLPEKKTTMRRV